MGEAQYYLKARYASEEAAREALPVVNEFVKQAAKAHHFWQDNRGKPAKYFWQFFTEEFPLVVDYLGALVGTGCGNELVGELNFDATEPLWFGEKTKKVLFYTASVWSGADWTRFAQWLKTKTGAVSVAYTSDEEADLFDTLDV